MHEEPQVLHYGRPGEGAVLQEGMVFTIEPMVNRGRQPYQNQKKMAGRWLPAIKNSPRNGEHTVAVTANGFEVLTLRDDEQSRIR